MSKLILFLSACLLISIVFADPVTVPNTFSAGTPAKASEVNANFTALANAVDSIQKPLMVYDSTEKLLGQYLGPTVSSNAAFLYTHALIKIPEATFISAISNSAIAPNDSNSSLIGRSVYYESEYCIGQGYVEQKGPIFSLFSGVEYGVINRVRLILAQPVVHPEYVGATLGFSPRSAILDGSKYCQESITPGTLYASNLIPVTKILDVSVLNFTPPFSVH